MKKIIILILFIVVAPILWVLCAHLDKHVKVAGEEFILVFKAKGKYAESLNELSASGYHFVDKKTFDALASQGVDVGTLPIYSTEGSFSDKSNAPVVRKYTAQHGVTEVRIGRVPRNRRSPGFSMRGEIRASRIDYSLDEGYYLVRK